MSSDPRVEFNRPDWSALQDESVLCADMHYHTKYSDSYTTVKSALRLADIRGVGVAITDHNLIKGAVEAHSMNSDVFLIPGMEVSTSDGPHILTYFYSMNDLVSFWEKNIKPNLQANPWLALSPVATTEWLLDKLECENCVVSAAHPMGYFRSYKGVQICIDHGFLSKDVVNRLDAYEVICSGMTRNNNLNALQNAKEHGLGYTGGTDAHLFSELGNVVTVSRNATDLDSFLDSIKKKQNEVIGTEKKVYQKVVMGSASLSRFLMHAPSSAYVQVIQGGRRARLIAKKSLK